ncbi:unnamed protein product, partial [Ascophyllum nodosum]
ITIINVPDILQRATWPCGHRRIPSPAKPRSCDGSPSHLRRLDRCRGADNASRDEE